MATSIIGIPTTRVSDLFIRQRLLNQVQFDQADLFRIQMQLSTGRRFEAPSEDPVAALRVMSLQRLLERKSQISANLTTNQSYLANTDVTLSSVSNIMADVRGTALSVLGTLASDVQRRTAAQQVDQTIRQMIETGNQAFRGRYLFAGTRTAVRPFVSLESGAIRYDGNEGHLQSYADINLLFQTNLNGNEVFGAISEPVRGSVDLDPRLTYDTRLADLRSGQGISKGSIRVSDGTNVSTIDVSSAETIGDLAALIKANPPAGRQLDVELTSTTIRIRLAGSTGNLSIQDVAGGTVAYELGIRYDIGVGTNFIVGDDLDPVLRGTTALDDLRELGVKAWAVLHSFGSDNDIRIEADVAGEALNDLVITLVDDGTISPGHEHVDYDPVGQTLRVLIRAGGTTAANVIEAINNAAGLPYTASMDRLDNLNGGRGLVTADVTATTDEGHDGGRGLFDRDSGLRIVNQNETFDVSFSSARTVEDMLNTLNGLGVGVLAEINGSRTGINVRSRVSGCDFMIGENGGTTATQLGLRTFTAETELQGLNFGRGVGTWEGTDFIITLAGSGTPLEIDVSGLTTIEQVIARINQRAEEVLGPDQLVARLAEVGNGIELEDMRVVPGGLRVERTLLSTAAVDLGLVPVGREESVTAPILTGRDVNTLETEGIFTSLIRLRNALTVNDVYEVQRSIDMLDRSTLNLNFARSELGARQQSLDLLQSRIKTEDVELRQVLSLEYDADMVEVVSNMVARQAAFEASLRSMSSTLQMSLLQYL